MNKHHLFGLYYLTILVYTKKTIYISVSFYRWLVTLVLCGSLGKYHWVNITG